MNIICPTTFNISINHKHILLSGCSVISGIRILSDKVEFQYTLVKIQGKLEFQFGGFKILQDSNMPCDIYIAEIFSISSTILLCTTPFIIYHLFHVRLNMSGNDSSNYLLIFIYNLSKDVHSICSLLYRGMLNSRVSKSRKIIFDWSNTDGTI